MHDYKTTYFLIINNEIKKISDSYEECLKELSKYKLGLEHYCSLTRDEIISGKYMDSHEGVYSFFSNVIDDITKEKLNIVIMDVNYIFDYILDNDNSINCLAAMSIVNYLSTDKTKFDLKIKTGL